MVALRRVKPIAATGRTSASPAIALALRRLRWHFRGEDKRMSGEPLTILDGARIEVEGREVLVVLTPFGSDAIEEAVTAQLAAVARDSLLAFATRQPDGSYSVVGPATSAALRAKLAAGVQWTKIPVYRDQTGR